MTDDHDLTALRELLNIMATLRSAKGCQWDRQQTPESLKPYILEECYELLEAIDRGHPSEICDELGDLLLQVVFQAQIFFEQGDFRFQDVAAAISRKLVRRHPHIFAQGSADGHEQRWEEIKLQERRERGQPLSLAERIPKTIPALKRAQKIAKRSTFSGSYELISEMEAQLDRLKTTATTELPAEAELKKIFGDLLFKLAHFSYHLNIDAEEILRQHNAHLIAKIDAKF